MTVYTKLFTPSVIGASKIARDITEKIMADRKLWMLANHDNLTQLPNRRMFIKRLESEISRASRHNDKFSIMYMDLDDFKQINDIYGHATGDQLLVQVSNRLNECFRKSDTVARLGGDEFAALLPNLKNESDIQNIKIKIQNAFLSPFEINHHNLPISVSIGVAIFPADGVSIETLLHHSDVEMYCTKADHKKRK